MSKHPIVAISSRDREISITIVAKDNVWFVGCKMVRRKLYLFFNHSVELANVNACLVSGVANASQKRTRTLALHRRLTECSRVGEPLIVKDVIQVEALNARLKSVERQIF